MPLWRKHITCKAVNSSDIENTKPDLTTPWLTELIRAMPIVVLTILPDWITFGSLCLIKQNYKSVNLRQKPPKDNPQRAEQLFLIHSLLTALSLVQSVPFI